MSWRWKRILTYIGIVAVCAVYPCFFGFFGLQTTAVLEARGITRQQSFVTLVPIPLRDSSQAVGKGTRHSYLGYSFEVPWDDMDEAETRIKADSVVLVFRSGLRLIFKSIPPGELMALLAGGNRENMKRIYGEKSDYQIIRMILETTPDEISLTASRQEDLLRSTLLLFKSITVPEQSGIFTVQSKEFNGFQYGDPQRQPRRIVADLYNDQGSLEFVFCRENMQPLGLSQAEVNRVVYTLRKSPGFFAANAHAPITVTAH